MLPLMEDALARTGWLIKRQQVRQHNAGNAALGEIGLTIVQWDALRRIDANPDASLHDLAQLTFQSDQSFGMLAARMEHRGLIERVPGPGRAIRHRLTTQGQELLRSGAGLMEGVLAESFAPLSAGQLAELDALLLALLGENGS
jgi:DNA-binding MarR family transcriptional regulator